MEKKNINEQVKNDDFKEYDSKFSALKNDLFERLKKYRDDEENEFCIVDRTSGYSFVDLFRESMYQYEKNTILCERIFFKSRCKQIPVKVRKLADETIELIKEYENFADNLPDARTLNDDQIKEINEKIKYYDEKLKSNTIISTEEIDVLIYDDETTITKYPLVELKKLNDNLLEYIAFLIAKHTISYFEVINFNIGLDENTINMIGIPFDDYIDIVAQIE